MSEQAKHYRKKGFEYPETLAWHLSGQISSIAGNKKLNTVTITEDYASKVYSAVVNAGELDNEEFGRLEEMIEKPIKPHYDFGTYRHYRIVGISRGKTNETKVFLDGYRSSSETSEFD